MSKRRSNKQIPDTSLVLQLAMFGPIGRLSASGSLASLVALLLFVPLWWLLDWRGQLAVVVVASLAGIGICASAAKRLGRADPSQVVWDELCGMWLALLAAPASPGYWLGCLVLFRLLDITKPGPIGWCDRNCHGGLGIMLDDLIAGACSLGCMQLVWLVRGVLL